MIDYECFDAEGRRVRGVMAVGHRFSPDFLDWRPIEAKSLYLQYLGGPPPDTRYILIRSQGETLLVTDLIPDAIEDLDFHARQEKSNGAEEWLQRECLERGINLTGVPRNQ